jgi:glycosyltransferase involved in cell wall biosynthesis
MSLESALDTPDRTAGLGARTPQARVAVLCDFLEEQWPSMNLVADMLCRSLVEQCSSAVAVTQLRPAFRHRFAGIPGFPSKLAHNGDRWMNRFRSYPVWLRDKRSDFDLFHIVDHSYSQLIHSLPAGRTVVTCHDLDTFRCLLSPQRELRPFWFRAMSRRILDGFQRAAHVIAVSEATRGELLRHNLFPPDRITVIANGVHPACSPLPEPAADAAAASLLRFEKGDGPLLLSVGSTLPRKRLDILLRVFAAVRRESPGARLIRVGGLTPELERLAAELAISDAISIVPFLDAEVLAAVYRRCALLLHTAEAEGFGLPIIEAMACGCAVVASDIPVLQEVGGRAAVYCPIQDTNRWKDTVVGLLQEQLQEPANWEARRQQGLAHAARFSWAENAKQTSVVYQRVMENT